MKKTGDSCRRPPEVREGLVDLVRAAFGEFLADLLSGSSQVEVIDPNVRAQKHAFVQKQLEAWKVSRCCIVEGCEAHAIQGSHAIQRAGPLQHVAENGFVLAPRMQTGHYGMVMRRIGIRSASTFPGFCSRHEQLFGDFEQRRQLQDGKDFVLQAYRATCREVVRLQVEHAYFKQNAHLFHKAHDDFMASDLAKRIRTKGKHITPDEVRGVLARLERTGPNSFDLLLQTACEDLEKLRTAHLKSMEEVLFDKSRADLPVAAASLPIEIPVCLAAA
jgi:hypothetical protein